LICKQVGNRLDRCPPPWLDRFQPALRSLLPTVPRPFPVEFILPRAFQLLQRTRPTACSLRFPGFDLSTSTRLASERLPWGFVPSSRRQSDAALPWVPMPHDRVFPESPRLGPALSGFPSSAFHAPSTACSASDLASLFHPAAAFRVPPSGVSPSIRVRSGFLRTFPLLPLSFRTCGLTRASPITLDFRGFLPASSAVTSVMGEITLAPRPSWSSLSSGFSFPILAFPFGMPPPSIFPAMSPPRRIPGVLRSRE